MAGCGSCNPCGDPCKKTCCQASCLSWGFDGCFLRGRCADGTELDPLDLCAWLRAHETCTEFSLVPDSTTGGYMQFVNECNEVEKLYVCDFLSLGKLECLGNVYDREDARSCDLLVFSPDCGDEADPRHNKWTPYHIPDAGSCEIQPDNDGYYKVLTKNACGCIKECKLFAQSTTWEYMIRDSWPDDPDEPFKRGSYINGDTEIIDLKLDQKIPMFGKTDLEVTYQYGFGIQNNSSDGTSGRRNIKSTVIPVDRPTHTPNITEAFSYAVVVQGTNNLPWGSHEWQVSRTVIVPKGQKLYLNNSVEVRDVNGTMKGKENDPGASWRLHSLRVFVRSTKGVKL